MKCVEIVVNTSQSMGALCNENSNISRVVKYFEKEIYPKLSGDDRIGFRSKDYNINAATNQKGKILEKIKRLECYESTDIYKLLLDSVNSFYDNDCRVKEIWVLTDKPLSKGDKKRIRNQASGIDIKIYSTDQKVDSITYSEEKLIDFESFRNVYVVMLSLFLLSMIISLFAFNNKNEQAFVSCKCDKEMIYSIVNDKIAESNHVSFEEYNKALIEIKSLNEEVYNLQAITKKHKGYIESIDKGNKIFSYELCDKGYLDEGVFCNDVKNIYN